MESTTKIVCYAGCWKRGLTFHKELYAQMAAAQRCASLYVCCKYMEFDWDEHNTAHIAAHQVTPQEFEQCLSNGPIHIEMQIDERTYRFPSREEYPRFLHHERFWREDAEN